MYKKFLKYWYIPFVIFAVVTLWLQVTDTTPAKIKKLEANIQRRNYIIESLKADYYTLEIDRDVNLKDKLKAQRSFKKIKRQYEKWKVKYNSSTIKTVTIKNVKYVKEKEYITLYKFTENFKNKFSLYLKLDDKSKSNIDKILDNFKLTDKEMGGVVTDQEKIISLKSKPKRWGFYVGLGYTQNKHFAFNVSFGYKIL